ncbi:hypothetical protein C8J57DRAFT_1472773 [Mycena rebaudengoi]|nr:hypothetical protein C8J57DRAFT_1472773 [Mycena rebaudengoi]
MAKCATKNIEILADVTRQSQARIEKLSLDLGNLTIELRLGSQHSLGSQIPAHSINSTSMPPTPPSETGELEPEPSVAEDLQNLFDRVYDLEGFVRRATERDGGDEALFERVLALEDRAPPAGGLNITVLSQALATRFDEIMSDRNKLSAEIRFQAEKQAKIDAKVRLEQKEMTKAIEDMQRTIARLELGSAAPLRLPARASDHRTPPQLPRNISDRNLQLEANNVCTCYSRWKNLILGPNCWAILKYILVIFKYPPSFKWA